jgi:hypothetical protein
MKIRTLQGVDSYHSRLAGIKGGQLRSVGSEVKSEVRSELVCFQETDVVQGSSRCEEEFFVCHSRREDALGPARNGASRRESVIISLQN